MAPAAVISLTAAYCHRRGALKRCLCQKKIRSIWIRLLIQDLLTHLPALTLLGILPPRGPAMALPALLAQPGQVPWASPGRAGGGSWKSRLPGPFLAPGGLCSPTRK